MRTYSISALLILILAALLLCSSVHAEDGSFSSNGTAGKYPMTFTDSADRNVTIQMPIERIIVLSTDAAEAVELMEAEDMIVGVSDTVQKYSWTFPNLKKKALVGKWSAPDYETIGQIAKGNEDSITPNILVLGYPSGKMAGKSYAVDAVEAGLKPFKNISVAGFSFYKADGLDEELRKLGQILNKEDKAQEYIAWKSSKREAIASAVKGESLVKVYFESAQPKGLGELKSNGAGADIDRSIRLAGGINVFGSSKEETVTTDWETVIKENPDIIFQAKADDMMGWRAFPSSETAAAQKARDEIMSRAGGSAVNAIKNDKIWILYRKILYGPGSVVGATYMAKLMHPEADLDPEGAYKEYLDLLGVDYPERRTFVYPELESD